MRLSVRKVLVVGLMFGLVGCSSTTFVYNRLNFIIPWYVKKYVDLDQEQKKFLGQQVAEFLHWHRKEELASYLLILDDIQRTIDETVTAEAVAQIAADFEDAALRIEARSLEWMLALGETLSDEQMAQFMEELREKQLEYEDEYLTRDDDKYHEEAYDNLKDSVQDFMGRLDWGQRSVLETAAADLQRSDAIWLAERAQWLDRMENILQREQGWQQAMRDSLAAREEINSPEYQRVYEHNTGVIFAALAQVLNSRTEKQDIRLRKKLSDLREDIESLIAQ